MYLPDILVPLAGIFVGGMIVLVPLVAFTARFAIQPLIDAWAVARRSPLADERVGVLEQRLELIQQQLENLERQNERLLEDADFRLRLGGS